MGYLLSQKCLALAIHMVSCTAANNVLCLIAVVLDYRVLRITIPLGRKILLLKPGGPPFQTLQISFDAASKLRPNSSEEFGLVGVGGGRASL
ncbi:hypothetical protein PNOK_0534300 [Pyrrhoderma noxium]|uniref:Uncharacterized protein n=1 Tax=Pyrrhoderma noxium TaxID=2282107 RepID=A0A286UFX6_9AGAM|nr:hypothetical protein PNOK_0534300 [Pyrrhoderma noxium]